MVLAPHKGVQVSRYAVIDIETTGLSPAHAHRIVEIAVVLVDDKGEQTYEWETVVNPERDVGATEIHGLTAADVYSASTFSLIAGELESLLRGRVPVAHNLSFDGPFLAAEFGRAGYTVPLGRTTGLCTMRLASHYLPLGPRTLEACCDCIGCRIQSAHAALEDARGTAVLLRHYIREDREFLNCWSDTIAAAQSLEWPAIQSASCARHPSHHRGAHQRALPGTARVSRPSNGSPSRGQRLPCTPRPRPTRSADQPPRGRRTGFGGSDDGHFARGCHGAPSPLPVGSWANCSRRRCDHRVRAL